MEGFRNFAIIFFNDNKKTKVPQIFAIHSHNNSPVSSIHWKPQKELILAEIHEPGHKEVKVLFAKKVRQ